MFECGLEKGELFKKIVSAISDLVEEGNFQINSEHMGFQGMDSSHVSLVALSLKYNGFTEYRCDRDLTIGVNFGSLNKVLKCMGNNDKLKLKCQDDGDIIYLCFENPNNKRISNFELKLMDIDQEQLGIPETNYAVNISIPSLSFQKIIRDLSAIGDSVTISVNKNGVKFSVQGDIGNGDVLLTGTVKKKQIKQDNNNNEDTQDNNDNNNNDNNDDEDDDMKDKKDDIKETDKGDNKEDNNNNNNNDDIDVEAVDGNDNDDDDDDDDIYIVMNDDVSQTFAIRYLQNFTKATILSKKVTLSMGSEVPLKCHYKIDDLGDIAYYLAPKIDDDE